MYWYRPVPKYWLKGLPVSLHTCVRPTWCPIIQRKPIEFRRTALKQREIAETHTHRDQLINVCVPAIPELLGIALIWCVAYGLLDVAFNICPRVNASAMAQNHKIFIGFTSSQYSRSWLAAPFPNPSNFHICFGKIVVVRESSRPL